MQEQQILIELDAFTDNPIPLEAIHAAIDGEAAHYSLSKYGGPQVAPRGDGMPWRGWCRAFVRIHEAVARDFPKTPLHYHLVGRAPLPLFAFAGAQLSKWATITVHNQSGSLDRITLPQGDMPPPTEPRFFAEPRFHEGTHREGKVGLYLSTDYPLSLAAIQKYMAAHGQPLAGVVELVTPSRSRLTAENGSEAAAELGDAIREIRQRFPGQSGLVLFMAGPVQLGLIAGRVINPRILGDVEAPNFAGGVYVPATTFRFDDPSRLLIIVADPTDISTIKGEEELQAIHRMLEKSLSKTRITPRVLSRSTHGNFLFELQREEPEILHISAHGSNHGDVGLVDRDGKLDTARMEAVARALGRSRSLRLVLINACHSKVLADALIQEGVPCAIGYDEALDNSAAMAFSEGFYGALAAGQSVAAAMERGKDQVRLRNLSPGGFHMVADDGFDPERWVPYPRREW